MLIHILLAAALLSPGSTITAAAKPAAAMVCRIVAEIRSTGSSERHITASSERRAPAVAPVAPSQRFTRLTTQLRR